jgi:hypothetical protein
MDLSSIALGFDHFMKSGPGLVLGLLYLAIVAVPLTFLHEWGHALAARRLLGGDVHISVGNAGRVAQLRLGQITATVNALGSPTRVGGYAEFDASRARARDVVLIALCGPLASLLGLLIVIPLYLAARPETIGHGLLWAAVICSAGEGVLNLVPFDLQDRRGGPIRRTDGGVALDAAKVIWRLR